MDDIEDESSQLHERSLVMILIDESGSMSPGYPGGDFDNAMTGGKEAVQYLKGAHTAPHNVRL